MVSYLAKLAFFTLAYVGTALVSLQISGNHDGITPIWPPSGIALFAFHRYGLRMWPVIALGLAFLGWQVGIPPLSAAIATVGNIGEAMIGCLLLRRFNIHIGQRFGDVVKFLFLPVMLSPIFAATLGATGMALGGAGRWEELDIMWLMWWIGDACGILLFTPLFYGWWRRPKIWSTDSRLIEWLIVISATLLIGGHTFSGKEAALLHGAGNLQFLVMPFLLWAAIRLGLRGVTLVSLICCGWVLWGAANNTGPFEMDNMVTMGLFESSFILVITLTGLIVQSLFRELALNIEGLRTARNTLEERVKKRTADLEQSNSRLHQEIDVKKLTQKELSRSEQRLYKAKEAAEQANDSKTRFLTAASHDLRQPLQALLSQTELLSVKNHDPELDVVITQIGSAGMAMRELLEKLLGVSEIDAGLLSTNPGIFPIDPLLKDLKGQFQQSAQDKEIVLKYSPCSVLVYSDPALIRVILQNLISNAIKYTEKGKVLIGCRRRKDTLRLCVCDTGIGIAKDRHRVIFEEFFQLDNPTRSRKLGSGFGLATVQRITDLLNYPLYLHSIPGKGSCFAIDIPVSGAKTGTDSRKPGSIAAENAMAGRSILLIDDDEMVLHAISLLLKSQGYQVSPAADAEAAFDIIATGMHPDIIISDYRLPGAFTGTELVTELRSRIGALLPAIILTGDLTLGTDDADLPDTTRLLQKPVPPQKLKALINQLLENSG